MKKSLLNKFIFLRHEKSCRLSSNVPQLLIPLFIALLFSSKSFAQPGTWTWMSGDTTNAPSVHGLPGQFDPSFHPLFQYEANSWKDKQGNFWYMVNGDSLWEYDPVINQWAFIKGSGTTVSHGIKGVSDPFNTPGSRFLCTLTWVDTSGNFWMYSAMSSSGFLADMWRYEPATNEWTWMSGGNTPNDAGVQGIKGVPSVNNYPGMRAEVSTAWVDSSANTLWFYGGQTQYNTGGNDTWKYDIATNEWTWMQGDTITPTPPQYAVINVADPANTPGGRGTYTKWQDANGDFWMFAGWDWLPNITFNDVWRYEKNTNSWACMFDPASTVNFASGLCTPSSATTPGKAYENKISWTDQCGNFWTLLSYNTMWAFNPSLGNWIFPHGTYNVTNPSKYGTMGVPDPTNWPAFGWGAEAWTDKNGNFWYCQLNTSVVWKYEPDLACTGCLVTPASAFTSSHNPICPGTCTDFLNLSVNATSYQWLFPGASPDSSSAVNPTNICYSNPGSYDVQLIATNANGSDTLTISNYITVFPQPSPQSITQVGDTLFAIAGSASYQWYYNGNQIAGATDYFYLATSNGDYNVVATDSNGCEVEAVIFDVLLSVESAAGSSQLEIFPNPATKELEIQNSELIIKTAIEISIYSLIGEKITTALLQTPNSELRTFDVSQLPPGMYILEMQAGHAMYRARFIKQ